MERQEHADTMTGLFNRRCLCISFDVMLADLSVDTCCAAMCNIDKLKTINETYGRDVVDKYIIDLADMLKCLSDAESFRIGGDEFFVLFRGIRLRQAESACRGVQIN